MAVVLLLRNGVRIRSTKSFIMIPSDHVFVVVGMYTCAVKTEVSGSIWLVFRFASNSFGYPGTDAGHIFDRCAPCLLRQTLGEYGNFSSINVLSNRNFSHSHITRCVDQATPKS